MPPKATASPTSKPTVKRGSSSSQQHQTYLLMFVLVLVVMFVSHRLGVEHCKQRTSSSWEEFIFEAHKKPEEGKQSNRKQPELGSTERQADHPSSEDSDDATRKRKEEEKDRKKNPNPEQPVAAVRSFHNDVGGDGESKLFTIVMLSYKAPKSLSYTLQSLKDSGILHHPRLKEVIVYFQVMREKEDRELVDRIVAQVGRGKSVPIIATGAPENLPVAEATMAGLSNVKTPYVLYLECDRPVFPFWQMTPSGDDTFPIRVIDTAIAALQAKLTDVFRLQLYSSPKIVHSVTNSVLAEGIYGKDVEKHCLQAPELTADDCKAIKKSKPRVYNTAYCKHWRKFSKESGGPGGVQQQDLCDAMCFATWATSNATRTVRQDQVPNKMRQVARYSVALHPDRHKRRGDSAALGNAKKDAIFHKLADDSVNVADQEEKEEEILCMTSETCNWTNQPTMYSLEWYKQHIYKPCKQSAVKECVGVPGRKSAVLQEVFFVKHPEHWAQKRHKVCLHREGLFFHHEIDNRE